MNVRGGALILAAGLLAGCAAAAQVAERGPTHVAPRRESVAGRRVGPPPAGGGRVEEAPLPASTDAEITPAPDDGPSTFVVDTDGNDYGSGVVTSAPDPGSRARGPSRPTGTDCSAHFPSGARVAEGSATLELDVAASGATTASRVIAEQPKDQGFGVAARACARGIRFSPALDGAGQATSGKVEIRLVLRRP